MKITTREYRWASLVRNLTIALLLCVTTSMVARADSESSTFTAAGPAQALKGAPEIYESIFTATVGKTAFDKIGLHRFTKGATPPARPGLVVFYLPGTNMNAAAAPEDARYSFQIYLASHDVDVWAIDYRTHFVPSALQQKYLSELAGWTNAMFESDIEAAAKFVRATTGREKLFVAGFSRGVEFSYLYAAMHPERVQGIIALDGFIPTRPMSAVKVSADHYAEDIGGEHLTFDKRQTLLKMVIENPNQPAPIPKYKTARENLEHVLYGAGGFFGSKGGLANPQGGFDDVTVLAPLLITYDRYWPAVQDGENPFTPELLGALKTSKIPVIAFASTNFGGGWPTMVEAAAKSTGAPDPSFRKFDGWGHLDVLAGTKAESEVFAPTLEWLKQHQK